MTSKNKVFRKSEISRVCSMVAVCGFLIAPTIGVSATLNLVNSGDQNASYSADQTHIEVNREDGGVTSEANTSNITITLGTGVDITGSTGVGATPMAIYTRNLPGGTPTTFDGGKDTVRFDAAGITSTLNLSGNNDIKGVVGWHFNSGDNVGTADPIDIININGLSSQGVTFNDSVYAGVIELNSGNTVGFLGNVTGNIDYNGKNATVDMGNITLTGNIVNTATTGNLVFSGASTITGSVGDGSTGVSRVDINNGNAIVAIGTGTLGTELLAQRSLTTQNLNYLTNGTVRVYGNLDLDNSPVVGSNLVTFNTHNGTLQVAGDITGVEGRVVVSTAIANNGTVTLFGSTQTVTGHLGQSGLAINTLNVGGTGEAATSTLGSSGYMPAVGSNATVATVKGDVFAQNVIIRNNSTLELDVQPTGSLGYNLTGTVTTTSNGTGSLVLLGKTQTVTGSIGASGASLNTVSSGANGADSTFTGIIYAVNLNNSGTGTSTYQQAVNATNVGVLAGTSNFQRDLSATTTTISSGTGNFNTIDGTSTTNIAFSGTGTANLNQGLSAGTTPVTGKIDFDNNDGFVNLADGKTIAGAIYGDESNSANIKGIVNVLGAGTLSSDVSKISQLNVNRVTANAPADTDSADAKTLQANGHIDAASIKLFNDGTLKIADNKNINTNLTGTITTTTNGTGNLIMDGSSIVKGNVGAAGMALKSIQAGVSSETVEFNTGIVYANDLNYVSNGAVIFRGNPIASNSSVTNGVLDGTLDLGFVGRVNFGTDPSTPLAGEYQLGGGVDLDTQTTFTNANNAILTFLGSSIVDGQLGSGTVTNGSVTALGADAFKTINAGVAGSTVTFMNDVYVSANTFNVTGTGIVNLIGDLNGSLRFLDDLDRDLGDDGSVNVFSGQSINGSVTTAVDTEGILNFTGSADTGVSPVSSTKAPIGELGKRLKEVNFHAITSDEIAVPLLATQANVYISHDIYSVLTRIGNGTDDPAGATVATISATGKHLGTNLTLSNTTTLNTAGSLLVDPTISPVHFEHFKNADGTLTIKNADGTQTVVSRSTIGTAGQSGVMTTAGATLNFAIVTSPWASDAGGTVNQSASSLIDGSGLGTTSLVMTTSDKVNLSLLGSLKNGQSYTLINVAGGSDTALPTSGNTLDNSYVIDTVLSRGISTQLGDLIVTATRDNTDYITLSNTSGHFSNPAALRLGTLAANGFDYGSDMQTVLNILDIDQWGYGNNATNLAIQAKRLAPIANNSISLSMFRTTAMVSDNIGQRMHEMRISEQAKPYDDKGFWIRSMYQQGKQNSLGAYDGFDSKISGFTMGIDARPNRESILGAALSYSNTKVEQRDFRAGDQATANAWHLSLYGAYDFTPELFVDGTLTASTASLDSARATAVGRTAKADTDVNQLTGKINLGYRFKLPNSAASITPMLSYESGSMKQDAYSETGAGDIGLSTPSQRFNWNRAGVGLRLATTTIWGGMVAKPELTVMAQNENGNFAKPISSQYIGDYTNTAFTTEVADKSVYGRSSVRGTLGLSLLMSKSSSLSLRYDHTNGDDFKSNALDLMARWKF